jgi:hypothetical protein
MNDRQKNCSVCKKIQVVSGTAEDYRSLSHYHYRDTQLGPFAAIFALKGDSVLARRASVKTVGVIVYTMPTPALELRNIATGDLFVGLQRDDRLLLINRNVRTISRVIIEPRFRSLGLAARLVRETMPMLNVPIIEAMAVMGIVNPFFEKAGMQAFTANTPVRCVRLIEAFDLIGIETDRLIDANFVQGKIDRLPKEKAEFIESEIGSFLRSYGKRRTMSPGIERTRYVLTKLTCRPVYYIWLNKNLELRIEN